jgi:hypothetical protein
MKLNIAKEVKNLKQMSTAELVEKYCEVFGEEPRSRHNKTFLLKRIAWRMQAIEYGDLSEKAKQKAQEIANDADLRIRAPKGMFKGTANNSERTTETAFSPTGDRRLPMPGTVLTREYKGEVISVTVLNKGFEYEGKVYKSLSAVAKAVTGSHWNGFKFFELGGKESKR